MKDYEALRVAREMAAERAKQTARRIARARKAIGCMVAVDQQRALLNEAAAFLDNMAERLDLHPDYDEALEHAAADCRAMAAKLRGETDAPQAR